MSVDLLFKRSPLTQSPIDLRFGADELDEIVGQISAAVTFPPLVVSGLISEADELEIAVSFGALTFLAVAGYVSNAQRPTVGRTISQWQVADQSEPGVQARHGITAKLSTSKLGRWSAADRALAQSPFLVGSLNRLHVSEASLFDAAERANWATLTAFHQNSIHASRLQVASGFQNGVDIRLARSSTWEVMLADRRPRLSSAWQEAIETLVDLAGDWQPADPLQFGRQARHREAIRPPAGRSLFPGVPVTPPVPGCYTPPHGDAVHLLFTDPWTGGTTLRFVCDNHSTDPTPTGETVVVPIRKVYMVTNNVTLRKVDGNVMLPTLGLTMSIDVDSWTWGFSASLPGGELAKVMPNEDGPIELEATINGTAYRLIVEKVGRDRSFNVSTIRISGRGKNARLDAPYAAVQTFANSELRTSQQLMDDVLTDNGVSIGWDVSFGLDPWLVPAGAWNHQGTYISAINTIAAAAGGYLQPHNTDDTLRVLARYPTAPWEWGSVTPDFELPVDVTTQEGIEWLERARYNRVFVSGQAQGILGQVTRTGTAGDLVAPMVTDALITETPAARQRGISVLGNTGRIANVTLRLPVLAETGVIPPGKFVSYVDGATTRLGIVRSTAVDVGMPEVWQTVTVETHDE